MELAEVKELVKEKGVKKLCQERIKQSKSVQVTKDSIFGFEYKNSRKIIEASKDESTLNQIEELDIKVVANMAMYMDSDNDVLLKTCWNRSIAERGEGDNIPLLKDHIYKTDAIIGKTKRFLNEQIDLSPYGYTNMMGDALVHEAKLFKSYDEKTFSKYLNGSIKQHSIGLFYVKLDLALNEPEYDEEYRMFQNYVDKIINKEKAIDEGYFWLVSEIFLREDSAVVFGANPLTPTLDVDASKGDTTKTEGAKSFFYNLTH